MVRLARGSGYSEMEVQMLLQEHQRLAKMFKSAPYTLVRFTSRKFCSHGACGCSDPARVSVTPRVSYLCIGWALPNGWVGVCLVRR